MDEEGGDYERGRRCSLSGPIENEHARRAGLMAHRGCDAVHRERARRANGFFFCDKEDGNVNNTQNIKSSSSRGVFGEAPGGGAGGGLDRRAEPEGEDEAEVEDVGVGSDSSSGDVVEVWNPDGGRRTPRLLTPTPTPTTRNFSEDDAETPFTLSTGN